MARTMVDVPKLVACLRELSDAKFQSRSWLASSAGCDISSFSEQVSQTFDDTGLAEALDRDKRPPGISEEAFRVLRALDSAVAHVDQTGPPERLLEDSRVENVRQLAAHTLALITDA